MKELLYTIVKNLVDDTKSIRINEKTEDEILVLELLVAESDIGKVIGKQGKIAKAIRSIVKSSASYKGKKVIVKIL